jgi:hypothetical protein
MPMMPGAETSDQATDLSVRSPQQASPSMLAGEGGPPPQPQQPQGDEGLKQVVQQVRQMQMGMMDLARQFPAAASSFREAASALRAGMRQIVTNPGSPEPPAPNIGG